jgi:hypothetical protein
MEEPKLGSTTYEEFVEKLVNSQDKWEEKQLSAEKVWTPFTITVSGITYSSEQWKILC